MGKSRASPKVGRPDTLAVSVCDLPAGSYDLRVGGAPLPGVLLVVKEDGKAKVVFDSQAQGQQQPLEFPVAGTTVRVTPAGKPGTVLLTGVVKCARRAPEQPARRAVLIC